MKDWIETPLFDQPEPAPKQSPTLLEQRREAMQATYDHADEQWKEEYEAFIVRYLRSYGRATAEHIRTAYEKAGLPQTNKSKRASGAIFTRLRRKKVIREVGRERSQIYGNFIPVLELAEQ